jgi:RNA polymerase sigma-70 factor (ECF subfamily)
LPEGGSVRAHAGTYVEPNAGRLRLAVRGGARAHIDRVAVILSDLEEFSYPEIAATLGVPIGTVRSRLARARGALQKIL